MAIKHGDLVQVISGKDAGKQGKVTRVFPGDDKVIVEGVNTAKRHQKPRGQVMQGGIIDKDMPIHVSNVMLVCRHCGRPRQTAHRIDAQGDKHRVCRTCGGDL